MLFHEPAGSLASAFTLVDYAIKLWRFLSPKAQEALRETRDRLSRSSNTSLSQAETMLLHALHVHVSPDEVDSISHDISRANEVMAPMVNVLEDSRIHRVHPKYGLAVDLVAKEVYKKLNSWRCFNAWGHNVKIARDPIVLPMPYTDAGIRNCKDIRRHIQWFARRGQLCLANPEQSYPIIDKSHLLWFSIKIEGGFLPERRIYISTLGFGDDVVDITNRRFDMTKSGGVISVHSKSSKHYQLRYQDVPELLVV